MEKPVIRSTTLHKFLSTPFQSILEGAGMMSSVATPQMLAGTALHALFFETGQKIESVPKTTKKIFEEGDTIFVKDDYYKELLKINNSLKETLKDNNFLSDGIIEKKIIIEKDNYILQGTPDFVNDELILDYKTTATFSANKSWYWRARKIGYLCQMQHYDNLCNIKYGEKNRKWANLVQSTKDPYEVMFFEFDQEIKVELKQWYDSTLERYLVEFDACKKIGFKQTLNKLILCSEDNDDNDSFDIDF